MVDAQRLWDSYLKDSDDNARLFRAVRSAALYYILLIAIMAVFGFPNAPCRGNWCRNFDFFVSYVLALPSALLLTFFVIDGTLVNRRFIRYLTYRPTDWCKSAFHLCGERGLDDPRDLREWLDIQLIARRTAVVGEFVYFPFLILFLLLISRNSCFANWDWPPGVVIAYLLSALVAISSVVLLRHSAETVRRKAADVLGERAAYYTAKGESGKADAVNRCVTEIESERRGAFSLLSQHPLLAAIVLPSGGIGVWALLEYLAAHAF